MNGQSTAVRDLPGLYTKPTRGFTLIELMIVVVIVAVLAAIAIPSYSDYMTRTKRTAAKSALLDLASLQEQFYMDNKSYTSDLTNLGFAAAASFYVNGEGEVVAATASDRVYQVSVSNANATTFDLLATALLDQATHDTNCAKLTLNTAGTKGSKDTSDNPTSECW